MSKRGWQILFWVLWALAVLALARALYLIATGNLAEAVGFGIAAILFYVLHSRVRRYQLGWIIDERGERQKVVNQVRDILLYEATSREARLVEEVEVTRARRRSLLLYGVLLAVSCALFANTIIGWKPHDATEGVSAVLFILLVLVLLVPVAILLVEEIRYRLGVQDMVGAKVLDPPLKKAGIEDVHAQKAHGQARPMTEQEALDALKAGR